MNVFQAINAVQRDLAATGIGKDSENTFDKYKFRGIDAVYNALSPLLAKHGLCVLPRMLNREVIERTAKGGNALFYVTVEAEFDLVSAEDGSKHTVRTFGEAMDRGDKATNKAMSAAYKYAAFQTFAIPTEGDNDADASSHEVKATGRPQARHIAGTPTEGAWEAMGEEEQAFLMEIATQAIALLDSEDAVAAHDHIQSQNLSSDEKIALWTRFDSKQRSALKRADAAAKSKPAQEAA
ncbi:ERF family protein [Luteibacter sp. SG786]|uniref:ERF family protein n=1 Tax=Luteibacter sp. SG786 TaxID=2587130 RepID=UPI00142225BF|nr:ERF family protein [Luteibacter sp. SG786]NII54361.1 hypothetical protein [Luteibacter sp. SG786]